MKENFSNLVKEIDTENPKYDGPQKDHNKTQHN